MLPVLVYLLTALAVVDIVLTRRRLVRDEHAGNTSASRRTVDVHTVTGGLGILLWAVFLVVGDDSLVGTVAGILGLGLLWVTTLAGLLLLMRWLPTRGRHAEEGGSDNWSQGPWLSVLAHVGMLVGVSIFTIAYLTGAV